ncbi:hypothetical protein [Fervidibacter sacchari]
MRAIRKSHGYWLWVRFMLPIFLLLMLSDLTNRLNFEEWHEGVKDALLFAMLVLAAFTLFALVSSFVQRYGWRKLLFWNAVYFACAFALSFAALSVVAFLGGFNAGVRTNWVGLLVFSSILGQMLAWFSILIHLLIDDS